MWKIEKPVSALLPAYPLSLCSPPSARVKSSFCLSPSCPKNYNTRRHVIFLSVHQIFSFAWNQIFAPLIFSSFHYAQKNILYFDQENDAWEAFHYRGYRRTERAMGWRRATVTPTGRRGKDRKGDMEEGLGRGARGGEKKKSRRIEK